VVIGLFGLSSSFGALVLSRRREFGVLRHIGMTRRQIGSMLAAQGLLVSALGLAVGLTLGWVISLVLIHVVNRHSFHWGMELHLPWQLLAEFVAVMLVLATFTSISSGRQAAARPARRARRLRARPCRGGPHRGRDRRLVAQANRERLRGGGRGARFPLQPPVRRETGGAAPGRARLQPQRAEPGAGE